MKAGLLSAYVGLAAAALVCGGAIGVGDRESRRAGLIVAAGWSASVLLQQVGHRLDPFIGLAVIDALTLYALVVLAWRLDRLWPRIAIVFQSLALAVDLVRVVAPSTGTWAYLTALAAAGYGLLGALASAAWGDRARRRRAAPPA